VLFTIIFKSATRKNIQNDILEADKLQKELVKLDKVWVFLGEWA